MPGASKYSTHTNFHISASLQPKVFIATFQIILTSNFYMWPIIVEGLDTNTKTADAAIMIMLKSTYPFKKSGCVFHPHVPSGDQATKCLFPFCVEIDIFFLVTI